VRWVSERHGARGPLADLLADLADSDDLVPLLSTAVFFALAPAAHARAGGLHFSLSLWQWVGITVALGLVIGLVAAVLLGREFRLHESWGVLLGASVLGIGVAARLGLSSLATMFVAGVTLAAASRHRSEIRAMAVPTEQPVLLPVLLLAGANVHLDAGRFMPWVIAAAVLARLVGKLVGGLVVRLAPRARRSSPWLGASMLSSGTVAMTIGLAFAVRFPGRVGDAVLAAAAIATVFGEFVGPSALRRELTRAGEIEASSPPEATAAANAGQNAPGAATEGARPADASGAQAAVPR
jgi:hypothetical protein